ncbi:MAG: hypothetical protein FWC10_00495 [Lentimicrobiaceae bacterium]|nr:hypothetical protein [Lentimicrobiaceae bacterium]
MRKIINITIFALAGLTVILSVMFGIGFNQEAKDKFRNIVDVKASNPQMLTDLQGATVETLPAFIDKYQGDLNTRNADLKKEKKQRDIFYTFSYQLGTIFDAETFNNFKAKFPTYSKSMFAEADRKEYFVNDFNKVNSYADFQNYYDKLLADYAEVSQDYLKKVSAVKAETTLLKQVSDINSAISTVKKEYDLKELQKDTKTFKSESWQFNLALNLSYFLFFATCAIMLFFLLWHTFKNMKSNIALVLGIGAIVLLVFIGYLFASPELSPVAIKMQQSPETVRWIETGLYATYAMLFGTIAIIVVTMIINAIKTR